MRLIYYSLIILFVTIANVRGNQVSTKKISNCITESDIYIDEETKTYYSDLITIKFNRKLINSINGAAEIQIHDLADPNVRSNFIKLKQKYGEFRINKLIPNAVYGDTLVLNKRTGKRISIPDWSQVIQLKFSSLIPIDSIITELIRQYYIDYAEGPFQAESCISPNDKIYNNENNWAFKMIQAEEAWDLTKGDSTIIIAIHDKFGDTLGTTLHEDLIGKVDRHFNKFGNHGMCAAGAAAAMTNNEIGIASLGWNLRLHFYDMTYTVPGILDAVKDGVDIINFSWASRINMKCWEDAVKTALSAGIICVAAAGNDNYTVPDTLYPAAYNFGVLGQVIAVSATDFVDSEEKFIDGWNYSVGKDPIEDPTGSFIDIAAPGGNIPMLAENCCSTYVNGCGTSLAAPFVSALVGLLLSVDSTLTSTDVYNIITETADKIGQYRYDENGWNQYLGYGRINAHSALKKVMGLTDNSNLLAENVLDSFNLYQNYPNPFNPLTTIKYRIPPEVKGRISKVKNVSLKIFDVLGREVVTLLDKKQKPGEYEVIWDGRQYGSGIYFYILKAGNFTKSQKMMLLK